MLIKLVKYDLLFGLKRYSMLFLLLGVTWLSGLAVSLLGNTALNWGFVFINTIMSCFILGAYIITSLQFFYNALSSDESYFHYTIPANTISLVFSKLAVIWMWGAAMIGALVLIWVSLYYALLAPMKGVTFTVADGMLDSLIFVGLAQFIMTTCILAFAISLFNTPRLKITNAGIIVVAITAYLLMEAVGILQLGVIGLWQYIQDPEILAAIWNNTFVPGQETALMTTVKLAYIATSALLAPLFFWLAVKMVKKHRSV